MEEEEEESKETTTKQQQPYYYNNNNDYYYLETGRSERNAMLLKIPQVVECYFQRKRQHVIHPQDNDTSSSSSSSSSSYAKVTVSIDLLVPPTDDDLTHTQLTMELVDNECGTGPKKFSMNEAEKFHPVCPFSESSDGKLFVEGKISKKFDLKPHKGNLEEYWKLCRERINKYMTKTRQIQVIDNDNGLHMRPPPGMIGLKSSSANDKKKVVVKASDLKRTRRDRGQMEEIMFKLFERQPNWTLKQLLNDTDQPEQFLKDLLRDLCVYNNKGANQGTYELKPEYKKSSGDNQAPSSC